MLTTLVVVTEAGSVPYREAECALDELDEANAKLLELFNDCEPYCGGDT